MRSVRNERSFPGGLVNGHMKNGDGKPDGQNQLGTVVWTRGPICRLVVVCRKAKL